MDINADTLPLLNLFDYLRRRQGWVLGVEDYLALLEVMSAGLGVGNCQELEQLCGLLWAKSRSETDLLHRIFQRMQANAPQVDTPSLPSPASENSDDSQPETSPKPEPKTTSQKPDSKITPSIVADPVDVVVKATKHKAIAPETRRPYVLRNEYFPVTRRQMKQSWRYLRRPVRQGSLTELDVEASADKIGREGILLEPVLVSRRINQTDLVLLVDQKGSMVPFHQLSRQLVETASRAGRLRQTNVYYFHDCPDRVLYRKPDFWQGEPIAEVLANIGSRGVVLIVSDAGAARGHYDKDRVEETEIFIEQLRESARYFAWLNPMPDDSWPQTTAGEIARFAPMFPMSRQGLNSAISVLRGRLPPERLAIEKGLL